ncbi:hypothetical protein HPB51_003768 [Rhipicephalus microplus]|uniref:M13 family peptidase n=2 Tax=Rhipicephalus microplus TaxID=6941 RepID=A0A9J6DYN3_RHIMP|nr:hypothetical protein HPB51_003768 [Rhipicephalus microplus]
MGFYNQYIKAYVAAVFPQRNSSTPGLSDALIAEIRDMETDVLEQFNSVFEQRKQAASFSFGEFDAMVANNQSTIKGGWFKSFEAGLLLHPQLTPEDELLLSHAPLLGILARLVEKYGDVNMKYLLMWEFIQLYFPLSNLSLLATRFGSERKADVERPIYCAHHVEASFKVLLLSLGVVAHFSAELRNSIDARFDGLVAMAVKKVKSSAWFGADSKLQIANKLALVSKRMWPPKSLLVQKNLERIYADVFGNGKSVAEFWIQAHEVMLKPRATKAFEEASRLLGNYLPLYVDYDYALNSVKVATATVAPPSYYSNGTLSMFYGGLGFLMAMQLVKSIDGEGLRWTDDGSLVESILPNNSRRAYDDKVSCLGAPEENIFPEIPALEITYSSFKEATLRGEPDLALSSELTSGKVFFLTICYMTCTEAGYYNPMAADCNKLVRNSAYFAETYECPKGSSMNPERKCSFFS